MPNLDKIPRKLEDRSHLAFEFPQSNGRLFRAYLPFLENPKISESGKSMLNEHNLIGRPGSLFTYGGASSRSINLSFKISLLNLLHLQSTEAIADQFKRGFTLFFSDRETSIDSFKLTSKTAFKTQLNSFVRGGAFSAISEATEVANTLSSLNKTSDAIFGPTEVQKGVGFPHAKTHRKFYRELVGQVIGGDPAFDDIANYLIKGIDSLPSFFSSELSPAGITSSSNAEKNVNEIIDMVFAWVNLIRSSVLNNSTNTVQGPPTVRLTHGAMFNNVPCVAEDYSIRIVDESGFDVQTLTPKQLEVTMKLKENRVGDFDTFNEGKLESGDTVTGWEAIIKNNNIDPYNGLIRKDEN